MNQAGVQVARPARVGARWWVMHGLCAVLCGIGFTQAQPVGHGPVTLPGVQTEAVLVSAQIGDRVFDVARFTDRRRLDELLIAVQDHWSADRSIVHRSRRDDWQLLTRSVGSAIETVEMRTRGLAIEGRIIRSRSVVAPQPEPRSALVADATSVWRLASGDGALGDASAAWLQAAVPDLESTGPAVTHRDGGRVLTTRVGATRQRVDEAASSVRRVLQAAGFRPLTPATDEPLRSRSMPGRAGFLVRGGEEVAFTVSDHGEQRAVVLHWGRSP